MRLAASPLPDAAAMSAPHPPLARGTILLLGGIAALGSLATQLLVPALPSIGAEFGASIAATQLVISLFLIGLGAGQLLVGPLADRLERRRVLLGGLILYALASLVAALAGSLALLLAARLAQAIGSAAGLVTARVLLNALAPPGQAVAAQASLMMIVLISPALAPVLGGLLTEIMGWRAILMVLCGAGLLAVLLALRRIPATGQGHPAAAGLTLRKAYRRLFGNRRFLAATAVMGCSSAALYLFLGATPFLLEGTYDLSPRETGLCLLLVAVSSIIGTRVVGRLPRRINPLLAGTGLSLAAVLILAATCALWPAQLPLLLAPLAVLGLSAGLIGPAAITAILASEKGLEGTASSLAGALQMAMSAVLALALVPHAAQGGWQLALAMMPLAAASAAAAAWLAARTA